MPTQSLVSSMRQSVLLNETRDFLLQHVQMNVSMVRGDGIYLYDDRGRRYTDFLSQYGAASFGHTPAFAWEALSNLRREARPVMVQPFFAPAACELAQRLLAKTDLPLRHVVLTNSGAEAVEAALKMAKAATGRVRVVSLNRGFHGKTHGAVLATGNPLYREPFHVRSAEFVKVAAEDVEELERELCDRSVAAFLVEPVLGEGGMQPLSQDYLLQAQELCKKYGTALIVDEVQCGVYRTGAWLAVESIPGFQPDIVCLAKALGAGVVPIGAVLAGSKLWTEEFGTLHSSTFANNQVACSVALAVLDYVEHRGEHLSRHVNAMSALLVRRLDGLIERYPSVYRSHSGAGLMRGIRFRPTGGQDSYFIAHACEEGTFVALACGYLFHNHNIITAPLFSTKDMLRIEPPLIVEPEHIAQLCDGLEECARLIRDGRYASLLSYLVGRTPQELCYAERSSTRGNISAIVHSPPSTTPEPHLGTFAFLIHPPADENLLSIMPESIEGLNDLHRGEFLDWMRSWFSRRYDPFPVFHAKHIASIAGGYVDGWLIASPLTSRQMLRLHPAERKRIMDCYLDRAVRLGARIVGLGAFTSVITRGGQDIDDVRVPITTGNSLTGMSMAESLTQALEARDGGAAHQRIAVIGAAGSVGRIAALRLSEVFANIVVVGNPNNQRAYERLSQLVGEIYAHALSRLQQGLSGGLAGYLRSHLRDLFSALNQCNKELLGSSAPDFNKIRALVDAQLGDKSPIVATTNAEQVLGDCDGVASATSEGRAFIQPAWLARNAVVADAARPADLQAAVQTERPDVLVYEAGLLRLPAPFQFGRANVLGFASTVNLGCLIETIVLAMSGVDRSHSLGDRIPYDEAIRVRKLAQLHGFEPCVATTAGELGLMSRFNKGRTA